MKTAPKSWLKRNPATAIFYVWLAWLAFQFLDTADYSAYRNGTSIADGILWFFKRSIRMEEPTFSIEIFITIALLIFAMFEFPFKKPRSRSKAVNPDADYDLDLK